MAIKASVEKAKQKAAEEAARAAAMGNFGPMPFWKPKTGKNRIRIMPPWTDEGPNDFSWWREVWAHWGIGPDEESKKNVSCPKKSPDCESDECPVCDEADRLRETGDPADLELAKEMRAKQRVYVNMIDTKDPVWTEDDIDEMQVEGKEDLPEVGDPKIQVFSFGPTIFRALLDYYTEDLDMTDPEEGYDVVISKEGKGINTKYMVRLAPKPSKAPCDEEHLEPIKEEGSKLHNLDQIMQYKSSAALQAILDGVDPDEADALEAKKQGKAKKQLASGKGKAKAKAKEEEPEEEDLAVEEEEEEQEAAAEEEEEQEAAAEEEEEQEASGSNGVSKSWPPKDEDGYFAWDGITDEQIEDPMNEKHTDESGSSVYIGCFGAARQRDDSDDCKECPLFKRCGDRITALDKAEAAKKKAAGKKAAGKKAAGKKAAGKKAAGKKSDSAADDLQAEMEAAIAGKRK